MNTRNTKQKDIILDILEHNRIHPTMQEIYELAKKEDQNIGQATIYRNINKLVEDESSGNYDEELMNAINYYFTKSIDFIYSNDDKIKFINDDLKYKINEIALTFNDTTHYENLIDYIEQLA